MTGTRPLKALVIGAGIGGLTTAVALRRAGLDVEVYERAGELRPAGFGISVGSNAVVALRTLGIDLGLDRLGQGVEHLEIMHPDGRRLFALPHSKLDQVLNNAASVCLYRGDLQAALLEAAGDCPITLGAVATRYERDGDGVRVRFEDGREARGDVLIGADGIHSVVRRQLTGATEGEPRYSGFIAWMAVTPFSHPRMVTGYSGHYWGAGKRFGIHDIGHGRTYWWATRNMPVETARRWVGGKGGKEELGRSYAGWAEEVGQAIRVTPEQDIMAVAVQDRPFLEQWGDGPVTLLGDAAHPMLPSLAQGGSSAMEDAVVLAQSLASADDPSQALRRYEDTRRARAKWMVNTSHQMAGMEQLEGAVPRLLRNAYLRLAPSSLLTLTMKKALAYPGVPADQAPAAHLARR